MTQNSPPNRLSVESKRIWKDINGEWELDNAQLLLLKTALESYDLMSKCAEIIENEGILITSPSGIKKANPALNTYRDARTGFLSSWKLIGFHLEPPRETAGRPWDK